MEEFFENTEKLYLVSYLNQSYEGYNPWEVIYLLCKSETDISEFDWDNLQNAINGNEQINESLDNLKRRVTDFSEVYWKIKFYQGNGTLSFAP